MMLGAIVAVVVCAGSVPAEREDVPAASARPVATPTPTPTPTSTSTATATATPTPTSTSTSTSTATSTPTPTPTSTSTPTAADEPYAPPLPTAPAGPPLADVGPLLLSRVARPGGHAVERLIEGSGDIVEHEVNSAGTVQSCRTVGSLQALPLVAQQPTAGGEYLQVARDASGALVQFVVSRDGEPRAVVVAPAN